MADMRISGTRGGAGIPPEGRKTTLSSECKSSIEHTKDVAERTILKHFEGVELNITKKPPVAKKVNQMLFKHQ